MTRQLQERLLCLQLGHSIIVERRRDILWRKRTASAGFFTIDFNRAYINESLNAGVSGLPSQVERSVHINFPKRLQWIAMGFVHDVRSTGRVNDHVHTRQWR